MAAPKCTTIPRQFSWIIPAQSIVTGIAIYSTVYVFKVGSKPFIFAVVAAGLQFLLGLYTCVTANKPGLHRAIIIPPLLAVTAGVWCAPVYYFSQAVKVYIALNQALPNGADWNSPQTWSYVGLAMTCLDVVIPLVMLVFFLVIGLRAPKPRPTHAAPGAFGSAPVYTVAQYQQYQQPLHYQEQAIQPVMTNNTSRTYQTYEDSKFTGTVTLATPVSPTTSQTPLQPSTQPYNLVNRVEAIRRLCAIQYTDGHWEASLELADLARQWGGHSWAAGAGYTQVAQVAHACLHDLCRYVWTAQWEHAEQERLSAAELASLQMVNWDLGFAKTAMDRATTYTSSGFG